MRMPDSTPAWFISMVVSVFCVGVVGSVVGGVVVVAVVVGHRFAPLLHAYIPFLNMAFPETFLNLAFSKTLVYTHAVVKIWTGVWAKPMFLRQNRLCHKELFYTKTVFYTNTMFSCWACARAVCGLQDSPFHGGRRNTPKAVKYCSIYVCGRLGVLGNQNFNNTKITPPSKYQCPKPGLKSCISLAPRTILGYICRYYMVLPCITYEKRYDLQHDPHTNSHEPFWAEPSCKSQSEWPVAMHGRSD